VLVGYEVIYVDFCGLQITNGRSVPDESILRRGLGED
jgi:hypothetical protein